MVLFDVADRNQQRLCHVLLIVLLIAYHNSIWDRHYLLCLAIVHPQKYPWHMLYENADASSFLHLTGLNQRAFNRLLDYVFDLEEVTHQRSHGRPCLLSPEGYLGLLFYLGSTMTYKHLCFIFCITPTVCSHSVNWMLKKVVRLLMGHPFVRVKFPNGEKMR